MTQANGILSGLFGRPNLPSPSTRPVKSKENLSAKVNTMDLSPESIVTSDNFVLVEGVLQGAVEITPDIAQLWLSRNKNIRPLQVHRVAIYAKSMTDGTWDLNGETIKFDKEGNLVDGQNRLTSCIRSGKSFKSSVVYGIDSAVNVDGGKARLSGQLLHGIGVTNRPNVMAAMINFLHAYDDENSRGFVLPGHGLHPLTKEMVVTFAQNNMDELSESLKVTAKTGTIFNKPGLHAALHYLFSKIAGPALATQFYESLQTGVGLTADSPIYQLREKLLKERAAGKQPSINPYAGLIIKGWNQFITGRKGSYLRFNYATEGVPRILRSPVKM